MYACDVCVRFERCVWEQDSLVASDNVDLRMKSTEAWKTGCSPCLGWVQNNSICDLLSKQSATQEQSEYCQGERQWRTNTTSFCNTDVTRCRGVKTLVYSTKDAHRCLCHMVLFLFADVFALFNVLYDLSILSSIVSAILHICWHFKDTADLFTSCLEWNSHERRDKCKYSVCRDVQEKKSYVNIQCELAF